MKTWVWELAVVWLVLIGVVAVTHGGPVEAVGTLAVLATFAHAVHCHRWSTRYFFAKELLWLSYFVAHRSWSALVGVGVFLAYPLWRKWWRARHPLLRVFVEQPIYTAFISSVRFDLMPGSRVESGKQWRAVLIMRLDRAGCEFVADISRAQASVAVGMLSASGRLLAGDAKPRTLQFFDKPEYPGARFAQFVIGGEKELNNVTVGL